jgi:hypothetical protein
MLIILSYTVSYTVFTIVRICLYILLLLLLLLWRDSPKSSLGLRVCTLGTINCSSFIVAHDAVINFILLTTLWQWRLMDSELQYHQNQASVHVLLRDTKPVREWSESISSLYHKIFGKSTSRSCFTRLCGLWYSSFSFGNSERSKREKIQVWNKWKKHSNF